jgi:hypothetical protein
VTLLRTDAGDDGPRTRALVIGVGAYLHMPGGDDPRDNEIVVEQLTSPPLSARRFADWLWREYRSPHAPLATVDLLISSGTPQDAVYGTKQIERALFQNVDEAFGRWSGALGEDDVGIVFFSGHGIGRGIVHALLLEDYGKDKNRPFAQAFDVSQTWEDMVAYPARTQYWFVDACDSCSRAARNYTGPLATPLTGGRDGSGTIMGGLFEAAARGTTAYGPTGQASYFTQALVQALNGLGSVIDAYGENWVVKPDTLASAIVETFDYLVMTGQLAEAQSPSAQINPVDRPFHIVGPDAPKVPVLVGCEPDDADLLAVLSVANPTEKQVRPQAERHYVFKLEHEHYDVEAFFDEGAAYATRTDKIDVKLPRITRMLRVAKRS